MRILDVFRLRLRSLIRRRQVEQQLGEEPRYHLDQLIQQNVARGMSAKQARAEALRQFGGMAQIEERCRDARRTQWLEEFLRDCRYAFRLFGRNPGFTAVAVLSLPLAIGANTAVFSLLEALVLRPLPVFEPQALVQVDAHKCARVFPRFRLVPKSYRDR
ncbi:MAG: permease prefix domain 1-containing protein [Acidobacteriota bacterium]